MQFWNNQNTILHISLNLGNMYLKWKQLCKIGPTFFCSLSTTYILHNNHCSYTLKYPCIYNSNGIMILHRNCCSYTLMHDYNYDTKWWCHYLLSALLLPATGNRQKTKQSISGKKSITDVMNQKLGPSEAWQIKLFIQAAKKSACGGLE